MAPCRDLGISTAPRAQQLVLNDGDAKRNGERGGERDRVERPDGRGQAQARPVHR
jgi:hypothetical protein